MATAATTTRAQGTDYGSDVSTFLNGDLDPNFKVITGPRVVLEAVVRGWIDARGDMFWDPSRGQDVRSRLNSKMDENALLTMRWGLEAEALKDPRVHDCTCFVGFGGGGKTLVIKGKIELVTGETFDFVFDAAELTLDLFNQKGT